MRIGTVVGTVTTSEVSATGLGLTIAAGHRFGRLALESELVGLQLQEQGPSSVKLGARSRLGLIVRYDVVRFGSRLAGPNTLLALFLEGGAAQTWTRWYQPEVDELARLVPPDTRAVEGQAGFGISVDHRFAQPGGAPNRVAWHLGWRFSAPMPEDEPPYACRGECRLAAEMPTTTTTSLQGSVLFQSSLAFTW